MNFKQRSKIKKIAGYSATLLAATSFVLSASVLSNINHNSIEQKSNKLIDVDDYKTSRLLDALNPRGMYLNGDVIVNGNYSYINELSSNPIISTQYSIGYGPKGYLVPISHNKLEYIDFNGKKLWECNFNNDDTSSVITSIFYTKNSNSFVILVGKSGNRCSIITINESNGNVNHSHEHISIVEVPSPNLWAMTPYYQDTWTESSKTEDLNHYIVWPRVYGTHDQIKQSSKKASINQWGEVIDSNIEYGANKLDNNDERVILSFVPFRKNSNEVYAALLHNSSNNRFAIQIYLRNIELSNPDREFYLDPVKYENKLTTELILKNSQSGFFQYNNQGSRMSFILNVDDKCYGASVKVGDAKYYAQNQLMETRKIDESKMFNLQDEFNIDFNQLRVTNNTGVAYISKANRNGSNLFSESIALIETNSFDQPNEESFVNRIKHTKCNGNLPLPFLNSNINSISLGVDNNQNILLAVNGNKDFFSINPTATSNGDNGRFAYNTIAKSDEIILPNNQSKNLKDYQSVDKLNQLISKDELKKAILTKSIDSDFNIERIFDDDNQNINRMYSGSIKLVIGATKTFNNGDLVNGKRDFEVLFSGFKRWNTTQQLNELQYDGNNVFDIDSLTNEEVLTYLQNKINDIFIDIPMDFNNSNIINVSITSRDHNVATVQFELNKWIDNGVIQENNNKSCTIRLTGFKKLTSIKETVLNNGIDADGTIGNMANVDFINNDVNKRTLLNWIYDKRAEIFHNPIDNKPLYSLNNIELDGKSSLIIHLIAPSYTINGIQNESYTFKINNFIVRIPTKFSDNKTINDPSFPSKIATSYSTDEKVKEYVVNNQDKFYQNPPDRLDENELFVTNTTVDVAKGEVSFDLALKRYVDETGLVVWDHDGNKFKSSFKLGGFRNYDLTTTINQTEIMVDLPDVVASSIRLDTDNNANVNKIKDIVIGQISNVTPGEALSRDDIKFTNPINYNDGAGKIETRIMVINNKAIEDGWTKSEYIFPDNITLLGFKTHNTELRNYDYNIPGVGHVLPSEYTEDLLNSDIGLKSQIANNVVNYNQNSTPPKANNIRIKNLVPNNVEGLIEVTIEITDSKAIVDGEVKETYEIPTRAKLMGFKKQSKTTWLNKEITDPNFVNYKASEFLANEDLQEWIFRNKEKFANDIPEDIQKTDFVIINNTINDPAGLIDLEIGLKKYFNDKGFKVEDDGQVFKSKFVLVGFQTLNTTLNKFDFNVKGVNNIFASSYTLEELTNNNDLKTEIANSIVNSNSAAPSPTADDIAFEGPLNSNNAAGTIHVSVIIKNSKAIVDGRVEPTYKIPIKVKLNGFKNDGLDTSIVETNFKVDLPDVVPSSLDLINGNSPEIDVIKQAIIDRISNINPGEKIVYDDIRFKTFYPSNINGSITTRVSVINNKAIQGGVPQQDFLLPTLVIEGLKKIRQTQFVPNEKVEGPGPEAGFVNKFTIDDVKNYVTNNPDKFFLGDLPDDWANHIQISNLNSDIALGELSFEMTLSKYYDNEGVIDPNNPSIKKSFILTGFRTEGLTTTLSKNEVRVNLPNILASDIIADNNDESIIEIKREIIKIISSPANESTVLIEDIALFGFNNWNNAEGSLTLKITLNNNKYWANGVVENSHTFTQDIKIIGFREINVDLNTTLKINSISYNDEMFREVFGSSNKGFSIDWLNYGDFIKQETELLNYMNDHITKFFTIPEEIDPLAVSVKDVDLIRIDKYDRLFSTIKYTGIKDGIENQEITSDFVIQLRKLPDLSNDAYLNLLITKTIEESSLNPSQNLQQQSENLLYEIKTGIAVLLNLMMDDLPDLIIPEGNRFEYTNISGELFIDKSGEVIISGLSIVKGELKIKLPNGVYKASIITYDNSLIRIITFSIAGSLGGTFALLLILIFVILFRKKSANALKDVG